MAEPQSFFVGDSLSWSFQHPTASAADGWAVSYSARGAGSFEAAATNTTGTSWAVFKSAADTAALPAGAYTLHGYATKAATGERATFYRAPLLARANVAAAVAGYDGRSHARRCLDNVQAVLEGRSSKAIEEQEIDGVQIRNIAHGDLLRFRDIYRAEVAREDRAEAQSAGRFDPLPGRILVRFV